MADEAPKVKPGYMTTEFWVTIAVGVSGWIVISGLPADSVWVKAAIFAGMVLKGLGYTAARANTKSGE